MTSGKFARRAAAAVAVLFAVAMALIFVFLRTELSVQFFTSWYSIFASVLLFIFLLLLIRSRYKAPEKLVFNVFGLPGSGKTVLLQTLLHRLRSYQEKNFTTSQPNEVLSATIARSMKLLTEEQWPSSSREPRDFYRVLVTLGSPLFPEKLQINIIDNNMLLPGQSSLTIETAAKSGVFRTLAQSNGIMFVIDSYALYAGSFADHARTLDLYMYAVNDLKRQLGSAKMASIPVALIMTKVDYVEHSVQPSQLLGLIQDFVNTCKKNFKDFRIFYVSSVGKVTTSGVPQYPLRPRNVIEPFVWMVRHFE